MEASTVLQREQLRQWRACIYAQQEKLVAAQLDLALGVHVMLARTSSGGYELVKDPKTVKALVESDPEGQSWRIVTERPDAQSLKDIFNRALGVPSQAIELTGKDGEPVAVKTIQHNHIK